MAAGTGGVSDFQVEQIAELDHTMKWDMRFSEHGPLL